jgi:hypothetical protein
MYVDRLDHLTTESEKRVTESERRVNILEFLKERQRANKNTNKTTMIKYLKEKGLSSRETSLDLINDLIREGKLNKKEINSQVHYLTINQENEFNKIYNSLEEIEALKNKMLDGVRKMKVTMQNMKTERNVLEEVAIFRNNFWRSFYDAGDLMLHRLLLRTKNKIHSEIDRDILYSKAIELLHIFTPLLDEVELDQIVNVKLRDARSSPVFEAADLDINLIDDILEVIKNFKDQFLTEQKTQEPHKKSG